MELFMGIIFIAIILAFCVKVTAGLYDNKSPGPTQWKTARLSAAGFNSLAVYSQSRNSTMPIGLEQLMEEHENALLYIKKLEERVKELESKL